MDNNLIQILALVLPPIVGIIIDQIKADQSKELIRGLHVCENFILDELNNLLSRINNGITNEFKRILSIKPSEMTLEQISSLEPNIDLALNKDFLKTIIKTYRYKKKLEIFLILTIVFRWSFYILISLGLVFVFLLVIKLDFLPIWYVPTVAAISILLIILFFLLQVLLNNLIINLRKKYGIESGI